ncbi:MAG: carboxypeptidase-like regulatory domain-containing protein, partial [Terriglobia bacterium]
MTACQRGGVPIDNDDIGGAVTSAEGPEAGVWVIAETTDLPTKFVRTVVTNDQGQYVIPDLPSGNYTVWVRGYGLVDSEKVQAKPGANLNLTAVVAPSEAAAAQYYPAIYWYSLLQVPPKGEFPGTGPRGNGISPEMKVQANWLWFLKSGGCIGCHQLGSLATRTIPQELGKFDSSAKAWERRIQSGQAGSDMVRRIFEMGQQRSLAMLGDWTDRIAAGELPFAKPERPQGVERNVVITQWDWADARVYLHDETSTDQRNPRINANGKIYGTLELAADYMPVLDPVTHTASKVPLKVRDANTPSTAEAPIPAPSPYWGAEPLWDSKANAHNPLMDHKGRVWLTARIRPQENPDFCKQGSDHPSAKLFPLERSTGVRQLGVYDPKTDQYN